MTATQPLPTTTPEIGGIGHSVKRHEDDRLLQGQGSFLDDHVLPGMLHMAILRSPVPHARINGIDTSAAEAFPGVKAVMTAKDIVDFPIDKGAGCLASRTCAGCAATSWRGRRRCSPAIR